MRISPYEGVVPVSYTHLDVYKRQANDMLRIGDWIALPGGVANGVVEEITLNTVKIRN